MKAEGLPGCIAAGVVALGARVGLDVQPARLLSWGSKGALAVLDQGLFSGANFLVNILLARWLPPEEYGAFAVALSVFYLLAGFHTAVLTEPMMVFGAGKYREHFRKYLGMLLWGHWAISVPIALVLGVAALVMARLGSAPMAQALAGLAIASPFLLLLWLARRAPYVEMRPSWALVGSGVNLLVTLGGVFLLWRLSLLSSLSGLVLLGAAAAVASLALLLHVRPQVVGFVGNPTPGMVLVDHRGYGGWNLLAIALNWASYRMLFAVLVPLILGLHASATLFAFWNIISPIGLLINALTLIMLPYFSRLYVHEGGTHLLQVSIKFMVLMEIIVSMFCLLIVSLSPDLLQILYGGKYVNSNGRLILSLYSLAFFASIIIQVFLNVLKIAGLFSEVPKVWLLTMLIIVFLSPPLMFLANLEGALFANSIAYVVTAAYVTKKVLNLKYGKSKSG